jgi:hypothetical protein
MKDTEFMWKHFKNLYDYQESILKNAGYLVGTGHKISDVSEKSGGNMTSEDAVSA